MLLPDMRTLIISFLITDLIITAIMIMLWKQNRKHFSGTGFWVTNFIFQSLALALISLRGILPDWITMIVSNSLVVAGNILGLMGLEYFAGIRRKQIFNLILLAVFVFIHSWFSLVNPDLPARNLNLSSAFLIIGLQVCWLVFVKLKGEIRKATMNIGFIFMLYNLVNIGRIVIFFTVEHPGNDYFKPNGFESLVLIFYQMLFILLTYALVGKFNKRLLSEVAIQEEKFSKSFHSSPVAVILTSLVGGRIIDVNKKFLESSGYTFSEVEGKIITDLNIWQNIEDKDFIVDEISNYGSISDKELKFRRKSGEILDTVFTAEIVNVGSEQCVLSTIVDITGRKQAAEIISKSEKKYRMLLQNLQSGVVVHDPDSQITFANEQASYLLGLSLDQMMGKTVIDKAWYFVEEDGLRMAVDNYPATRVLSTHMPVKNLVLGINRPVTNDLIWVIVNGFPEFDADEKLQHVVVTFNDITETKNLERRLKEKLSELEKFNKNMVGRENRMVELKQEINELCVMLEMPPRYKSAEKAGSRKSSSYAKASEAKGGAE